MPLALRDSEFGRLVWEQEGFEDRVPGLVVVAGIVTLEELEKRIEIF